MIPILTKLIYDNESLFEYERNWISKYYIPLDKIKARLIAIERQENIIKNDEFYNGIGDIFLDKYDSLAQILYDIPVSIANDLLCVKNGYIYIKKEKLNTWMDVLSYIPPSLFIAGYLLNKFNFSILSSLSNLTKFIDRFLSQFIHTAQPIVYLPEINYLLEKDNGLNDLHIHLNGSTESDSIWIHMLNNPYKTVMDFNEAFSKKSKVRKLTEQTIANFTPSVLLERLTKAKILRSKILYKIAINRGIVTKESKIDSSSFDIDNLISNATINFNLPPILYEIIFNLICFHELETTKDTCIASYFHYYLLIRGIVHRMSVMQRNQYGFSQFQIITENSFRYDIENFYAQRFLQLAGGGPIKFLKLIEGRFSPEDSSIKNHLLISRILDGFENAKNNCKYLKETEIILIAHFIKKGENNSSNLPIRNRNLRFELKKKAIALAILMKKSTKAAHYIKGIDAAASEFDANPDVFAHTFRFLRQNGIERFTFHAGEDFRHILSGIRYIFESIVFLELQTSDRLGHCTALGINPDLWIKRIGKTCIISQGEWLDNLVFVWHIINQTKCIELQKLLPQIENEISEYSYKVYGNLYPAYILNEAWYMRKYNPFLYLEKNYVSLTDNWFRTESQKEELEIRKKLNNIPEIKKIWAKYHRMDFPINSNHNEYDKLISINTDRIFSSSDIIIIQNLVLDIMATKGIVIETLPTSNTRISYYHSLDEYHLYRWIDNNNEFSFPAIVIGTDDPGIFSTNIYNEYAKAYIHIEKKVTSSIDRLQTICGLHQNSVIYNFKSHE